MHTGKWYPISVMPAQLREKVGFTKQPSKPSVLPEAEIVVDLFYEEHGRIVNCFFDTQSKFWYTVENILPLRLVRFNEEPSHFMLSDKDPFSTEFEHNTITEAEYNRRKAALSPVMQKRLERIESGNVYFRPWSANTPKYVNELVEAGLLTSIGRWITCEACYVPTYGYYPALHEHFEKYAAPAEATMETS